MQVALGRQDKALSGDDVDGSDLVIGLNGRECREVVI